MPATSKLWQGPRDLHLLSYKGISGSNEVVGRQVKEGPPSPVFCISGPSDKRRISWGTPGKTALDVARISRQRMAYTI